MEIRENKENGLVCFRLDDMPEDEKEKSASNWPHDPEKRTARKNKLGNHDQEPWKLPLRQYIEYLYFKRFDKERPDTVQSIEEKNRRDEAKNAQRRKAKRRRRQSETGGSKTPDSMRQ
jgi:hypothetical protein